MKERMLIINKSLDLSFFTISSFSTKYLIMLQHGKVADQGQHTNWASHSLTFPAPINLQPSFWASANNKESPSLDNPHVLFTNITELYSRNTNICHLCSLIFHKIYQGRNNNSNMSSSSTHCVAKKSGKAWYIRDLPNPIGKFMSSSVFSIKFAG